MIGFVPLRSNDELSKDSIDSNRNNIETNEALTNKWFSSFRETASIHSNAASLESKKLVINKYKQLIPRYGEAYHVELSASMHLGVLKNLCVLQEEVADMEGALESVAAATDIDQSDVSLWYRLSRLALVTGRLKLARHALDSALELNPKHVPSLHFLPKVIDCLNGGRASCPPHIASEPNEIKFSLTECSWSAINEIVHILVMNLEEKEPNFISKGAMYDRDMKITCSSTVYLSLSMDEEESPPAHHDIEVGKQIQVRLPKDVDVPMEELSQSASRRSRRQESKRVAEIEAREKSIETEFLAPLLEVIGNTESVSENIWWVSTAGMDDDQQDMNDNFDEDEVTIRGTLLVSNETETVKRFIIKYGDKPLNVIEFLKFYIEYISMCVADDVSSIDEHVSKGEVNISFPTSCFDTNEVELLHQVAGMCRQVLQASDNSLSPFSPKAELLLCECAMIDPSDGVHRDLRLSAKLQVMLSPPIETSTRSEVLVWCRWLVLQASMLEKYYGAVSTSSKLLSEASQCISRGVLKLPFADYVTARSLHNDISKLDTLDVVPQLRDSIFKHFSTIASMQSTFNNDAGMVDGEKFIDSETSRMMVLKDANVRKRILELFQWCKSSSAIFGLVIKDLLTYSPTLIGGKRSSRGDAALLSALSEMKQETINDWTSSHAVNIGHMSVLGLWVQVVEPSCADSLIQFTVGCVDKVLHSGAKVEVLTNELEVLLRILIVILWKVERNRIAVETHEKIGQCLVATTKLAKDRFDSFNIIQNSLCLCLSCSYISPLHVQQHVSRGLIGLILYGLSQQSMSSNECFFLSLCIQHVQRLAAPWLRITVNDGIDDPAHNLPLQRWFLEAATSFVSQLQDVDASSSNKHQLMLLRAPVCTLLVWLLTPVQSRDSPLYTLFPSLQCPDVAISPLSTLLDQDLKLNLYGVLRNFMIYELKIGEVEPCTDIETEETPMLALLELVMLDLEESLPPQYPLNFAEHDDNVASEKESILVATMHFTCCLLRDLYHLKLLPHLDDHKLKWRSVSESESEVRGSSWSLGMPISLVERVVRFMLPLFIAHEEVCRDSAYICPCWNELLPPSGFAKSNLDDQRIILQALFRTQNFWWPNEGKVIYNYLFNDLTDVETSKFAAQLGERLRGPEVGDCDQWVGYVRLHLYRLIVERIPIQGRRPESNKEHEVMESENAVLIRAALMCLSYDPSNTDAWFQLAQCYGLMLGCASDAFDASSQGLLGLSPEATHVITSHLLGIFAQRYLQLPTSDEMKTSTYPSSHLAIRNTTCLLYQESTDYYQGLWQQILDPVMKLKNNTQETSSADTHQLPNTVVEELFQLAASMQLEQNPESLSGEDLSRQKESVAAVFIHAYRICAVRSLSTQAVCYAHGVGLKSWNPLPIRLLDMDCVSWTHMEPVNDTISGDANTQMQLSGSGGWEIELQWSPPGEGAAAASQLTLFIRCLELLCFSLFEGLRDYPSALLPDSDPLSSSSLAYSPQRLNQDIDPIYSPLIGDTALRGTFPFHSYPCRAWRKLHEKKVDEALALVELTCSLTASPSPLLGLNRQPLPQAGNTNSRVHLNETFTIGAHVEAKWRNGSLYYPATVVDMNKLQNCDTDNGVLYDLHYDDGEKEYGVPHNIVRPPIPFEDCLPPRVFSLTLLRAKLLCKRNPSIYDVDIWELIFSTYQSVGTQSAEKGDCFADTVTALSELHRCRLKLVVKWLRLGEVPPTKILSLLETFKYRNSASSVEGMNPLETARRVVLRVLNDCAAAFEFCVSMSPYHHESVVALARTLAERRRAEVVYSSCFVHSNNVYFTSMPTSSLSARVSSLEVATNTSLIWDDGHLTVTSVHCSQTSDKNIGAQRSGPSLAWSVTLQDALAICGTMFPDRKSRYVKNKLKLRRPSRPSSSFHSSLKSQVESEMSMSRSIEDDTTYAYGFGLSERRCCTRPCSESSNWLDINLRVGDKIIAVNKRKVDVGLLALQQAGFIELKILRHNPHSLNHSASATQSSEEMPTQSKTQLCPSSDSESLSDLEEQSEVKMNVSIDMDLKRHVGTSEALSSLQRLFSKKLPQIVGMWVKDTPESSWEELGSQRRNFDSLRLNYTAHYVSCLSSDVGYISCSGGYDDYGQEVIETLDKLLGYTLSIKDVRRDKVCSLLTEIVLSGLLDTLFSQVSKHLLSLLYPQSPGIILGSSADINCILSVVYEKYLVCTDPSIFPLHANAVEKRANVCLLAAVTLLKLHQAGTAVPVDGESLPLSKRPRIGIESNQNLHDDSTLHPADCEILKSAVDIFGVSNWEAILQECRSKSITFTEVSTDTISMLWEKVLLNKVENVTIEEDIDELI